jgi:hypothetical protein
MHKSNPVDAPAYLDEIIDFPTSLARQRRQWSSEEAIPVARLAFRFDPKEIDTIERELGKGTLASPEFAVTVGYRSTGREFELWLDEAAAVHHLRSQLDVPLTPYQSVTEAETIGELYEALKTIDNPPGSVSKLAAMIEDWPGRRLDLLIIEEYIHPRLPRLAYFADHDAMPGTVSIPSLIRRRDTGELNRGERALLSLLALADLRPEEFLRAERHEQLIRELENAANALTDEVFAYWSQSDQLDVNLAILPTAQNTSRAVEEGPILQVRLRDRRHRASVPFDERSRGFVWFFSFLAYVTELENSEQDLILLLDEPGLFLHGRAQQDLLRLITERLAPRHQVIYTTHSPFMISPDHLRQLRTVIDRRNTGTTVSADFALADGDTTAPLATAMALKLSRTLLTGKHTLLVDSPSDLIHLDVLSGILEAHGRPGLDRRWSTTPMGGARRLATLTALLGTTHLSAAILVNSDTEENAAMIELRDRGQLGKRCLVEIGEFIGRKDADVEDLYEPNFYIALVNHAYAEQLPGSISIADLPTDDPRIVRRVQAFFKENGIAGGEFNQFHPAASLLREYSTFLSGIDAVTLTRAERLFTRLNNLLP